MTSNFLILHALHPLAPSLINRDDTNSAKSILFGGTRRLRVSSQSLKRALVVYMRENAIAGGAYALRTNRFPALTADVLAKVHGRELDVALAKTAAVFTALNLKASKKGGGTAVAVYAADTLPTQVAAAINEHWDAIGDTVPPEVVATARAALDVNKTIDLALTGRMLAELPGAQVDGAIQMGHAFSVHPAAIESDFFTAVDDAAPDGEPMSSQLGTVDLAAPILYRSASLDRRQLRHNLSAASDVDALVAAAEQSFIDAFIRALPAAKRTSTNPATTPSLVLAVTGSQPLSLANAFTTAITGGDVLATATDRLLTLAVSGKNKVRVDDELTVLAVDDALTELATRPGVNLAESVADLTSAVA